jgi:hypothetical protein
MRVLPVLVPLERALLVRILSVRVLPVWSLPVSAALM